MATIHDLQQNEQPTENTEVIVDPNVLARQGISYEQQESVRMKEEIARVQEPKQDMIFVEGSGKHKKPTEARAAKRIVPLTPHQKENIITNPPTMSVSKDQMMQQDVTESSQYQSRYEPNREASIRARYDNAGRVVDPLQESLNLIDIHAERKKREMDQYFAEHPEDFPDPEQDTEDDILKEEETEKSYLNNDTESENQVYTKNEDNSTYIDEDELELEKEIEMDMNNVENTNETVNNKEPIPINPEFQKMIRENNAKSEEFVDDLLSNIPEDEMEEALEDFKGTKPIPATPEELAALTGAEATEDDGIEMIGEDEDDETDQIEEPIEKEVKVSMPEDEVIKPKELYTEDNKEEVAKNIVHMELPKNETIKVDTNINIDEEDFKDLEEDDESTTEENKDDDEELKELQKDVTDKIHVLSNKINLQAFTITKKPISVGTALAVTSNKGVECATWALMNSNRPIKMSAFLGVDMEELVAAADNRTIMDLDRLNRLYGLFYEHDMNPNKPAKLIDWLKTTSYIDTDDLYMAAYVATFRKSNHIPLNCSKCSRMTITENRPIMDIVRFKTPGVERQFNKITKLAPEYNSNFYKVTLVQISDDYVFAFKTPSLYDSIYKNAVLDVEFKRKYSGMLAVIQFIDDIYLINRENGSLQPIEKKEYPNNLAKTVKAEVLAYSKIIKTLTPDQNTTMTAYITEINQKSIPGNKEVNYVIPEHTCEKCGTVNKEEYMTAREMFFTRHQLTVLRTV